MWSCSSLDDVDTFSRRRLSGESPRGEEDGYPYYPSVVTAEERKAAEPSYNYSRYDLNWRNEYGERATADGGQTGYDFAPTPGDKDYADELHKSVREESFGDHREPNTGPNFWPEPAQWHGR